MATSDGLRSELHQTKPFESIEQELFLSIVRTADVLVRALEQQMRPIKITQTQYNVLRILRGAGDQGLPCMEVARRLVSSVPDITRLLNRMEEQGLILRERVMRDRRVVTTRISDLGRETCQQADGIVRSFLESRLSKAPYQESRRVIDLLEQLRLEPGMNEDNSAA